jgi:hypothetical protein
MVRISKQIMRVVLLLMLFQFFAPAFFPLVVQQTSHKQEASFHVQHSSVVAPLLLKEKDEKSHEEHVTVSNLAAILDLTAHSLNLTATHKEKPNYFHQDLRYNPQPALFSRLCTFLI